MTDSRKMAGKMAETDGESRAGRDFTATIVLPRQPGAALFVLSLWHDKSAPRAGSLLRMLRYRGDSSGD
jgi:hypothetical protein